jgi:hypothetical protein
MHQVARQSLLLMRTTLRDLERISLLLSELHRRLLLLSQGLPSGFESSKGRYGWCGAAAAAASRPLVRRPVRPFRRPF